jgi:hypothetical protein
MFIPAAAAGGLGLFLLILAGCGVGSKHVVKLAGLDELARLNGVKSGDAKAALAGLQASARNGALPPGRSLPFFHVRYKSSKGGLGRRIYRVFLAGDDFLFVSLHTSTLRDRLDSPATGLASAGVVGGLVAGANAYCQMLAREEYRTRTRALDGITDEHVLRRFTEEDPESFTLSMQGVRDLRIEPPSFWDKFNWREEIAAKIRCLHPAHGQLTLDLPCFDDVCKAIAELPKVFPNEVQVTASWNSF